MKKLLTILILLLAVCNLSINAEVVYSGDAHNVASWNAKQLPIADYPILAKASVGDVIAVTVSAVEDGARVTLQKTDYSSFSQSYDEYNCTTGIYYFVLNSTDAAEVATNGLNVSGEKYTFNKVELLYKKTLWTGTLNGTSDWEQSSALDKSMFSGLSAGNLLGIGVSTINTADWHSACLRYNYASNILDLSFSEVGIKVKQLTETDVTQLKEEGKDINFVARYLCISELCTYVENLPTRTFTYDISPSEGGTVEVRLGGTEGEVTTETEFPRSTQLGIIAKPASGYQFEKWKLSNGEDDTVITTASFVCTLEDNIHKTAVFTTIPAFSLDGFVAAEGNTYNTTTHELKTVSGWSGASLTIGDYSTYSGSKLLVKTSGAAKLKIMVSYVNNEGDADPLMDSEAVTNHLISLDNTKKVKSVVIQNQEVGTVTFTEMSLDPSYTLTITQPANGTIKNGESVAVTGTHSYGTELTLTAVPSDTYELSKWTDGTNDLVAEADGSLKVTMDGDKSVTAVFGKARTSKNLSTGSQKIRANSSVAIDKGLFTNAVVGDVLTINVSSIAEGAKYTLKGWNQDTREEGNKNWSSFAYEQELATNATSFTSVLTADILNIIQYAGLSIEGNGFTCGNVTLTTAGEVGTAQTHSNPTYTLTVNATGGTVAVYQEDGTTPAAAGPYELETKLVLKAMPSDNYTFMKWTEGTTDLTANEDKSLNISMDSNREITAVFGANPLVNEERRTLWEGAGQALSWSDLFVQTAGVGSIVEAGEILIVAASTVDTSEGHYPKISLRDTNSNEIGIIDPLVAGENRLSITSSMATAMAGGFKFQGESATITKIELYKPTPITKLAEEETRTLWVNASGEALTWNKIAIDRAAEWGAVLEEDERIIIHVKAKETGDNVWPTVQLQNDTEKIASTANLLNDLTVPCDITITLTAEMVNKMKNGFSITGDKATITKAELYKPTMPAKTVHTLNTTETAISGDANVTVPAAKFANISAYDVLTVNFAITTSPANLILKGNGEDGGWDYLKEIKFENGETLFALPLTPAMTSNLKKNGLQITGSGYTFKSVGIKTAGEVPSDEEKKDDDDEETIIDEKTGEADLTVLSAQDDSKTTLTENEDGSITMTTTEPYCAAQIWFNDPEPVAGNVLKVELAESSVNVTVTVKYTDGTESQMSANTMVAKARGETRSASGTTVEVPLESGKEVQNIEVKNNVAGTITIKKMQVTTVNVFTNGVANLSMLKPQSNATYDTAAHTLATTKGWTGATISPVANENVSGKELLIEFADASKVKVAVKYRTDVEGPSTIMEKAAKAVRLALDNTKNIQEISIQPTEASIVTFKKIAVNSEESDDGSLKPGKTITLWENAAGETLAWNEVAKQDASVGEMLKEYDELLITVSGVTKDCDWPKVFIRDASSEQAGNEVLLNDIGSFPYTVRIVLTGEMAQQLKKGFSICGDGVTVTKLQVYRPEAPKPGDIHLADLNYGYNSSYDKGTHTITTTARWAARGWEIGDKRYNDKNLITVKFEAVDFPVTLKMEYTNGLQTAQATSVGVPAGRTELLLEIPSGISRLNRVYIIYENPGSIKLTEVSVTYQDNLKLSTAIRSFEADGVIRDGRYDSDGWYNLRGMRIPEPKTSGVYIHGGKKVVIY